MGTMEFEYYSQKMTPEEGIDFKAQLDAMGGLGWELVQINPDGLAIFKRQIPEEIKLKVNKELLLDSVKQTYNHED